MWLSRVIVGAAALVVVGGVAPLGLAADYHLYLIAGQSNANGHGRLSELTGEMRDAVEGAVIFCGQPRVDGEASDGLGLWSPMTPGFGLGFRTDGRTNFLSDRFGPELSFAQRMRELRPGERVAIVKYSRGGSSLDARAGGKHGTWDPHDDLVSEAGAGVGVNQYDHALATIAAATGVRDIDGDGEPDRLIPAGIVWMQGETDATRAETARAYGENLGELLELLRAALRADEVPVAVGRTSDSGVASGGRPVWPFGDVLRAEQAKACEADPMATLVTTTDGYRYSDRFHYDGAGYLDLGVQFAEAIDALRRERDDR